MLDFAIVLYYNRGRKSVVFATGKEKMKDILAASPLFRGIGASETDALLCCLNAREARYRRGETILAAGRETEWLGVVTEGTVLIERCDALGNNSVLGAVRPGEVFAEAYACLAGEKLTVSATAAEDVCVLWLCVRKLFSDAGSACAFHTRLLSNLLTVCAEKNLRLSRRILHTTPKTIRARVISYFSELAQSDASRVFTVPLNRQQLADYLGVDRSALCRELSRMQADGLIRLARCRVELCGPADALPDSL